MVSKSCMGFSKTHSWTPKIQGGGRPPSWKLLNRHISMKNHTILMKYDTQQQIWNSMIVRWPNMKILKFKMADSRRIENYFWP